MDDYYMGEEVQPVEVKHQDPRWEHPVFTGYMVKQGSFFPTWRRRFMILTLDGRLWYFKNDKQKNPRKDTPVYIKDMKFWSCEKKPFCIKVERYPKPFFFYAKDANERLRWMEYLGLVGGIKCEKEVVFKQSDKNLPDIAKKDMKGWNNKHVLEWLSYHSLGKDIKFDFYAEQFQGCTGKDLESMTEQDLIQRGVTKLAHRKKIMRAIKDIRIRRRFNYYEHVVYQKIESMTRSFGKVKNANWKFLSRSLSDPECMQETYLNPSILQESLNKYMGTGGEAGGVDPEGVDRAESMYDSDEDEDEGENEKANDDGVEKVRVDLKKEKAEELKLPVKLVVTEMVRSDRYKTARKFLSPVLARIPNLSHEFGIFHTALIIGPWYLEWTDSSLVIPRKLYSGMALISADIESNKMLTNMTIDDITIKLSKVICRWNTTKTYCNMNMTSKANNGNCQEFVEEVMEELQISLDRKGAFGKFLENMKNKGKCEMEFQPGKPFKQKFGLDLDSYRFDTHQELDEFVRGLMGKDALGFHIDWEEEVKLLKSFDRAFWLRHLKKPQIEKFRPSDCPFKDPRRTKSYMVYS